MIISKISLGSKELKIGMCVSYEADLEKSTPCPSPPTKGRVLGGRIAPISSKVTVLELGSWKLLCMSLIWSRFRKINSSKNYPHFTTIISKITVLEVGSWKMICMSLIWSKFRKINSKLRQLCQFEGLKSPPFNYKVTILELGSWKLMRVSLIWCRFR